MNTGHQLLTRLTTLQLEVLEIDEDDLAPEGSITMVLRIPEGDVETGALALIFAIAVLSYAEARPAGVSEMHYDAGDRWTVQDLVEHLRFRRGSLALDTDYVRGRLMKTTLEVHRDGTVKLRVVNRASSARRWVAMLQGRGDMSPQLVAIEEEPRFFAPDAFDPDPAAWVGVDDRVAALWAEAAEDAAIPEGVARALTHEPRLSKLAFRKGVLGEEIPCRPDWAPMVARLTVYAEDPLGNEVTLVVVAPGSGLGPSCADWAGDDPTKQRKVRDLASDLLTDGDSDPVPYLLLEQVWAGVQQAVDRRSTRAVLVVHGEGSQRGVESLGGILGATGPSTDGAPIPIPDEIDGVRLWLVAVP